MKAKDRSGHATTGECRACADIKASIATFEGKLIEAAASASGFTSAAQRAFDLLMLDLTMAGQPNLPCRATQLLEAAAEIAKRVHGFYEELRSLRARLAQHPKPEAKG